MAPAAGATETATAVHQNPSATGNAGALDIKRPDADDVHPGAGSFAEGHGVTRWWSPRSAGMLEVRKREPSFAELTLPALADGAPGTTPTEALARFDPRCLRATNLAPDNRRRSRYHVHTKSRQCLARLRRV